MAILQIFRDFVQVQLLDEYIRFWLLLSSLSPSLVHSPQKNLLFAIIFMLFILWWNCLNAHIHYYRCERFYVGVVFRIVNWGSVHRKNEFERQESPSPPKSRSRFRYFWTTTTLFQSITITTFSCIETGKQNGRMILYYFRWKTFQKTISVCVWLHFGGFIGLYVCVCVFVVWKQTLAHHCRRQCAFPRWSTQFIPKQTTKTKNDCPFVFKT